MAGAHGVEAEVPRTAAAAELHRTVEAAAILPAGTATGNSMIFPQPLRSDSTSRSGVFSALRAVSSPKILKQQNIETRVILLFTHHVKSVGRNRKWRNPRVYRVLQRPEISNSF